ncbi:MAG: carboxypeptidase-like regulatory domain-containing protein, partial [Bacteroidota bacterium]
MSRLSCVFLLIIILVFPTWISAQTTRIAGTVTREDSSPIHGAHVQIGGVPQGVVTDTDGRFFLNAIGTSVVTLRVTHLGFATVSTEVSLPSAGEIQRTIVLHETILDIGEVIVTATRSQELLRNVALPLTIVDAAQLRRSAPVSVPDALDGAAGITL